ncbi:MAG: NADH-quinone oxidoreductase subunit NuoH [Bdellovibrionales bacterium]
MGSDLVEVLINSIKIVTIFLIMVQVVPLLVWVERRGSAFIQYRFGPNRIGPLGLFQLLADAVKFLNKEEFVPKEANRFLFYLAPVISLVPGALAMMAIPFSVPLEIESLNLFGQQWGPYSIPMQGAVIPMGILYVFGVSSLATYGLLIAGWGSNNKYALMGSLRASAQMVSYELALGLSVIGAIILYGSFDLTEIIQAQMGSLNFNFMGGTYGIGFLPNWGIFYQPVGFILFLTAAFAESNRLPFDLPEAEAELVAGYHTEYGGFKMNLFYIGEYGHMIAASALVVIFYFGGYDIPGFTTESLTEALSAFASTPTQLSLFVSLAYLGSMILKLSIFLWIYIWVRWTLPRFRYDQLMDLGWKTMLPWALGNAIVTAVFVFLAHYKG